LKQLAQGALAVVESRWHGSHPNDDAVDDLVVQRLMPSVEQWPKAINEDANPACDVQVEDETRPTEGCPL
jgi:hypothetical protein